MNCVSVESICVFNEIFAEIISRYFCSKIIPIVRNALECFLIERELTFNDFILHEKSQSRFSVLLLQKKVFQLSS